MSCARWSRWGLAVAGAALAGCGSGQVPKAGPEANRPVPNRVALESFDSCPALEQYIEDTAVSQMKSQLSQLKEQGGGGWWGGGWGPPMMEGDVNAGAPSPSQDSGGGRAPTDYTTTNTQVDGVDEADFVKNDGTRIFTLSGQTLFVAKSWPADQLSLQGTLQVEGWPQEMFLDGQDRLVIFSQVYTPAWDIQGGSKEGVGADVAYYYANTTKVTAVDVSDLTSPRVLDELYLPGGYVSSRRIDSVVRLVMRDDFRWPADVRWYPEGDWYTYNGNQYDFDEEGYARAVDALIAQNEQRIRAQALSAWLPVGKRKLADGSFTDITYACSDFHRPNAPTRLGLATVVTLDMANPTQQPKRTTVVGEVGHLYANADSLYLASPHWWWWPAPGQQDVTYLHKFDITNPNHATYVASGSVEGTIKDQFSLDEKDGFLRVATTLSRRVEDTDNPQNTWGRLETANKVSVLREDAGQLVVHGQTPELAKGERIFGVRFVGNRGFVVTFRMIDPLFTLDLSNPAAPRVVGELKIPGFSTYLHPVDENHLLAVGEDMDENGNWSSRALKVSLYDVSDMAAPREKFKHLLGSVYSHTEASYNHKAFNYFAAKKTLAIPFADYSWGQDGSDYWSRFTSNLQVLEVDVTTGFKSKGSLALNDMYQRYGDAGWQWSYWWQPYVRRSVMADDYVYAISDAGLRVAHRDNLSVPVATVEFPPSQHLWP